jgi:hypothetical protein
MSRRTWRSSDVAWQGGRRPYDLVKEVLVQLGVVAVVVVGLSLLFASPDPRAATLLDWAGQAPGDFAATTVSEIDATSLSATYGPPYQPASQQDGSTQSLGPISPQTWVGAVLPLDTLTDLVQAPLARIPGNTPALAAISTWRGATPAQQQSWANAYTKALAAADFSSGRIQVAPGDYGPLPAIVGAQYAAALTGGLDAALLASDQTSTAGGRVWYSNDQTRVLLYLGDSGQGGGGPGCISAGQSVPSPDTCWWYNQSVANTAPRHAGYLDGGTWGVINEVGNWPGAWWLVPYSFWYQWGYGASGSAADLYAMIMTGLVTLVVVAVPWIPGLRDIPKLSRVYRVMWADYYRAVERRHAARAKV